MSGVGCKVSLRRSLLTKQIMFRLMGSTEVSKDSAFLDVGSTVGGRSHFIRIPSWVAENWTGRRPDDASTKLSVHYLMMAIGKEKEYDQENKVQKR